MARGVWRRMFAPSKVDKEKITIQTGAGLKTCTLIGRSGLDYEFEVDMGKAVVGAELALKLSAGEVRGIPVSMGNPHYVMLVPEFAPNWQNEAAEIQRSSEFKQGVNVVLVVVDGKHDVRARFFERGAGETQSSGTGSCSSAVAAMSGEPCRIAGARAYSGWDTNGAHRKRSDISAWDGSVGVPGRFLSELGAEYS